jgi:myo-inositol-1(or 4)-monophosphatase
VAGRLIREAAARPRLAITKGETSGGRLDIVTATDRAVEVAIVALLRAAYPDHAILGEEGGVREGASGWQWVIDPVDGTRNFGAGLPLFAFNLALCRDGQPRLALTLDPLREETVYAEEGQGATLNGAPVRVAPVERLADAILAVDLGMHDGRARALLGELHTLFPGFQALRCLGSVALGLASLAAGRAGGYVSPSAFAWDYAPGVLLVREAGGTVTELDGSPWSLASRSVVAGPPGVHAELLAHFGSVAAIPL